jgi:hypothetical protein
VALAAAAAAWHDGLDQALQAPRTPEQTEQ